MSRAFNIERAVDRFVARIVIPGRADCWTWNGAVNAKGYGKLRVNGRDLLAHRFAYELVYGPIPAGVCVLHRCDNPPCGNPSHLFLGTKADNNADKVAKGRGSRGEGRPLAKLTASDVLVIRERAAVGPRGVGVALAREYGVSTAAISLAINGKNWRHV